MSCENVMNAGARGVKITCSGRLGGAEIARTETQKLGSIPLQTLDADVDNAAATARTTYGAVGVKIWIYRGMYGEVKPERARARRPERPGGGGRPRSRTPRSKPGTVVRKPAESTSSPTEPAGSSNENELQSGESS